MRIPGTISKRFLRKWSAKYHYHPNDIIRMFEEIGYQCYMIAEGNKLKQFGYVDEETIETIVYPMKIDQTLKNMFLEYIEETNEDDNN